MDLGSHEAERCTRGAANWLMDNESPGLGPADRLSTDRGHDVQHPIDQPAQFRLAKSSASRSCTRESRKSRLSGSSAARAAFSLWSSGGLGSRGRTRPV